MIKRKKILVTGTVQGVGFRPAVYRLAASLKLCGFVFNDTKGVTIELQGIEEAIEEFIRRLEGPDKPAMAQIKSLQAVDVPKVEGEDTFVIRSSEYQGTPMSEVTADIAACADCLAEMQNETDFRYRYPFINCTNCGPRYSIVKTIPYDRPNTTMGVFKMCEKCADQYRNVADRRFHAQPVACGTCGPKVWLTDDKGKTIENNGDNAIAKAARLLKAGKIVAIKGLGGFHLAVDALNDEAVRRLRLRKKRDYKPFAMMAASIEKIREYAFVSEAAERVLKSPRSPIVLLDKRADSRIAASVVEGVSTFGFMLCYAPLHYLIFAEGIEVLVMTSGNISDEPLICKNDKALEKLGSVADAFLMHDREIYRQVDDSIVHIVGDEPVLLRRSRGYVPSPILTGRDCGQDVFAAGADMKNTFCFAKGQQLICSEHIGDLEDAEVYHHYRKSVEHLRRLFEVSPKVVVSDLHPGYFSTQYALSMSEIEKIQVQHHWAHIASVLVENGLEGPVIGLECDGTGLGTDGKIWGCECLIATLDSFDRFGHLAYYPLAGGDAASKYAIRPLLGLLKKAYGSDFRLDDFAWLLDRIEPDRTKQSLILEQIEKQVNTVETSSLGRVFDATAAMVGLGNCNHFEAQLPMALEAVIEKGVEERYDFELAAATAGEPLMIDLRKTIKQMVRDIKENQLVGVISAKFHNTVSAALVETAKKAREKTNLDTAALSGGVFCNHYLINRAIRDLKKNNFKVLFNKEVPANDGGISLGQAAIGAYKAWKKANRGG